MFNEHSRINIRISNARVSNKSEILRNNFGYDGGIDTHEDAADYVNVRHVGAVKLA